MRVSQLTRTAQMSNVTKSEAGPLALLALIAVCVYVIFRKTNKPIKPKCHLCAFSPELSQQHHATCMQNLIRCERAKHLSSISQSKNLIITRQSMFTAWINMLMVELRIKTTIAVNKTCAKHSVNDVNFVAMTGRNQCRVEIIRITKKKTRH